jgi:hypothetical protein
MVVPSTELTPGASSVVFGERSFNSFSSLFGAKHSVSGEGGLNAATKAAGCCTVMADLASKSSALVD